MRVWRIANPDYPPLDGWGAAEHPGRWNNEGTRVAYASSSRAGCLLEILARTGNGRVPKKHRRFAVEVPDGVSRETFQMGREEDWRSDELATKLFGAEWVKELRSCILLVPSYIVDGEKNVLINPLHPEFPQLVLGEPEPVFWDHRIFG